MRRWLALFAFVALPVSAQTYPQAGTGDPRLQSVEYDPAEVIRLSIAPGLQTMVELASGENIQTIGVGDSSAWQVSAGKRGDFFFIKNVGANAMTNMSVVTTGRVYNFELVPSSGYGEVSPYHVRIVYPAPVEAAAVADSEVQFEYRLSGARAIRPASVYQDGIRTILEWPEDATMPAIFMLDGRDESLVNGEMQDGQFVLVGTPEKLIFRLGRQTAYATRRLAKVANDD